MTSPDGNLGVDLSIEEKDTVTRMGNHGHASEGARWIKAWLKSCRILLAWVTLISAVGLAAASDTVLRVVTYNIHGGVGPNGEGNLSSNMTAFRNLLQGEDVICLQEVPQGSGWTTVKSIFADYPYSFATGNTTTDSIWPWQTRPTDYNVILSKFPFLSTDSALIQTDPGGNKWQRHAQHVSVQIGAGTVHVFNFHNTYNWFNNDYQYEQSGLVSFRNYVTGTLGVANPGDGGKLVMAGDFNLLEDKVAVILPTPARSSNGLDHVCTIPLQQNAGSYDTYDASLSDHDAVWGSVDVRAPDPDPAQWSVVPAPAGAGRITMSAITATDPNGVQYLFANTSFTNGSHDSAWQTSPVFTDTGLTNSTTYSYRVKARDNSANHNETAWSAVQAATANSNPSTACDLLSFNWGDYVGLINGTKVTLTVPDGTNLTTLNPTCTVSPLATVSPLSGSANNFGGPVRYTVTAEDRVTTKVHTVTVYQTPAPGGILSVPPELSPGDKYRLVFVTSAETHSGGTDQAGLTPPGFTTVAQFNGFATSCATAVPALASLGTTWSAVISATAPTWADPSASVNARTNTATDPTANAATSVPIYQLAGLRVANGYADLWDGTIQNPINVNELGGGPVAQGGGLFRVWTGANSSGGNGGGDQALIAQNGGWINNGLANATDAGWVSGNMNNDIHNDLQPIYVMSGILTVPVAPNNYTTWSVANANGQAANLDSNHNGVPNGIEYFMGGTALAPATLPPLVKTAGTWTWTIAYDPTAAATFHFEVAADLASWTPLAPGDPKIEVLTSPGDAIRLTLPDGMHFCRLVVTP